MDKEKLNCPNCGAPIDEKTFKSKNCSYCGTPLPQLTDERAKTKSNIKIDKIINFDSTEEEVKQKLALSFVDSRYDKELFVVNPEITTKKIYIPVWFFEVSYKAPWSCIKLVERASYNPNIAASERFFRIPIQGLAAESFDYEVRAAKNTPNPSVHRDEMKDFPLSEIDDEAVIYDINIEQDIAWNSNDIKNRISSNAEYAINSQLPDRYEDLSWSVSYNYSRCFCVLVACWELTYEYKNKKYTSYAKGKGGYPFKIDGPLENDAKITESKQERFSADINPRINLKLFGWSCFFLFLFAIVFGIYGLANNYPVILWPSALLALLSCIWGINMNILQQEEDDLISKIKSTENKVKSVITNNSRQNQKDERLLYILSLNNPLLEPNIDKLKQKLGKIDDTGKNELDEQIHFYHNKLSSHKRRRFLYGLILLIITLITIVLGTGALNSREQSIRAEQAIIEQEQLQKQQEEEQLQNEINDQRDEQDRRINAVLDLISPQKLLKVNNNGSYQLRENLAQTLLKLEFEKEDSDDGSLPVIGEMTKYIFNVD